MTKVFNPNEWYRCSFGRADQVIEPPKLMRLQTSSYDEFLQREIPPARREDKGLQAVFKSVFPIFDFNKTISLEFVSYSLETPKYSEQECKARGLSYESPLKVTVRLVFFDVDEEDEDNRTISSIKEQEVYLGNIPLMTETGSFTKHRADIFACT